MSDRENKEDKEDPAPLSRAAIEEMAAPVILGRQLVSAFYEHLHDEQPLYSHLIKESLLETEPEEEPQVEPQTDAAFAAARRDPDFLMVRLSDFERVHGDLVPHRDRMLIAAVGELLGLEGREVVYWPPRDESVRHPHWRTESGMLGSAFGKELAARKLSWIDLAMNPDEKLATAVKKSLADPHEPEKMALALIGRRLERLEDELSLVRDAELEERAELRAAAAAAADKQAVEQAWSGFFGKPFPPAATSKTPRKKQARGVAESLGDRSLSS
jgi:hypothetical protein